MPTPWNFRRTVFLPETVEDERQAFFCDAHAVVADDEQKFHAIFFNAQPDLPAVGGELQGVEQQVERDFFQLVVVAQDYIQFGIYVDFQSDSFGDGQLADGTGEAVDEFRHGDGFRLDLKPPGFEPDQVEQIVDELEQPHAVGLHGQEHIASAGVELGLIFLDERFQRREQQGQRRAQFVADVGEETALELVKLDELPVGFFEFLPALIELVTEGEFAVTGFAMKEAAGDDNQSC